MEATRRHSEEWPIYTFNLAGYRPSALPAGERGRFTLGGFTDATFTAMKMFEAGHNAEWPFRPFQP